MNNKARGERNAIHILKDLLMLVAERVAKIAFVTAWYGGIVATIIKVWLF